MSYHSSTVVKPFQQALNPIKESLQYIIGASSRYSDLRSDFEEQYPSTATAESALIEEVLNHFRILKTKIETPSRVREYLYRHPEIAELSKDVSDLVYLYFDFKTQLSLEVVEDDDQEGEYLALYLRVPEYDESVMDRIKIIQESYYPLLSQMTGWFLFTTDFFPPR